MLLGSKLTEMQIGTCYSLDHTQQEFCLSIRLIITGACSPCDIVKCNEMLSGAVAVALSLTTTIKL